jgi:hypothetical protein
MAKRKSIDPERVGLLSDPIASNSLRETIANEPITFLLGSGISLFPPSSVISGQFVTKALASRLSQGVQPGRLIRRAIEQSAFEHVLQLNPNQDAARNWLRELFGSKEPNSIHIAIAKLCRDICAHVITTNYDTLLELAGLEVGLKWRTLVDKVNQLPDIAVPTLFKIHGCVAQPESMLFTMSHEAPLPSWKADHFDRLTRDRIVIVIGYSGKDFEICPALLGSNAKSIIWNMFEDPRKRGFPSENAEHLFEKRSSAFSVVGDMHFIFQVPPQRLSRVNETHLERFFSSLSQQDFAKWRIALLDSIGTSKQAAQALLQEQIHLTRQEICRAKVGIAYRGGRYISSAFYAARAEMAETTDVLDRLFATSIATAFRFRNYGAHIVVYKLFIISRFLLKNATKATRKRLRINHAWLHVLLLQRLGRPQPVYWRRVRTVAMQALREGQWGTYYLVREEAEKLGIDAPGRLGISAPLLPSRQGFKHIGNLSSRIDDFSKDAKIDQPRFRSVLREILIAQRVGLQPNRWKCALASLIYSPDLKLKDRVYLLSELFVAAWRCQYSIPTRLGILYHGTRAFLGMKARSMS